MNEVFSIKRFLLLFRKVIIERPTQTLGVTTLLLLLSKSFCMQLQKRLAGFNAAQNITFIWGLAGGGFFLSSFVLAILIPMQAALLT